ncbi:hypothetical protein OG444_38615 [Streptomyces sp. NBC_01232]|uniref:hypothetical protein n=1 Tax=unclassified Streptomyces TaxID=2593676 RepID=UPI002E154DD8|nr:hypothetical protein OG444_38615 [Streptomyces sp. NBC_01232]
MRTTVKRALTTLAAGAAVVMMATVGASAATTADTAAAAATPAALALPAAAPAWEHIGEFSKAECYSLRDSYAGKAKCVRNAGGLYDLYVKV